MYIFRFSLELKRKSMFYVLNIILPCVMLSVLQLMVFRVPSAAGEKVSLSITLLLSFTVFLLMVSDNMPQTSTSVPLLGKYLVVSGDKGGGGWERNLALHYIAPLLHCDSNYCLRQYARHQSLCLCSVSVFCKGG